MWAAWEHSEHSDLIPPPSPRLRRRICGKKQIVMNKAVIKVEATNYRWHLNGLWDSALLLCVTRARGEKREEHRELRALPHLTCNMMGGVGGKICEPSQPSAAPLVDCELCTGEARQKRRQAAAATSRVLSPPLRPHHSFVSSNWTSSFSHHVSRHLPTHLKGTVEVPGEFHQLLLHRLADGAAVAVQSHAVHQQETEQMKRGRVKYRRASAKWFHWFLVWSFFSPRTWDCSRLN